MRHFLPLYIVLLIKFSASAQNSPGYCSYSPQQFNSDSCCWRVLEKDGFYIEAAQMIASYKQCNRISHNSAFNWHQGQMYALAGDYQNAKKYIHKSFSVFDKWFGGNDGKSWYWYAKGTLAFLNSNPNQLERIIRKWERKFPRDNNFKSLLTLKENFSSEYIVLLKH